MKNLTKQLEAFGAEVIHVGQFDYSSVFRERRLRKASFLEWAKDPRFANVIAYWDSNDSLFGGNSYYTEEVAIDSESMRRYPNEDDAVVVIAELCGEAKEVMPRHVLRQQIERAEKMGFDVDAAFEFEFILLDETDVSVRERGFQGLQKFAPDNKCWSGTTAATHAGLVAAMEAEALAYDIALFGIGGELGAGCFEGTLAATRGLKAADDAAFFRLAMRAFARKHNLTASFMPYLGNDYPGIGGHITMSLKDRKTGKNLFSDAHGKTSEMTKKFIAGMTVSVPECFALCTNSVNAYRRLAPGSWAPKSVSWAEYTFTTAVRSVPSKGESARLEFRSPPADCNPYLTMALMLGSGLDGIENNLSAIPAAEAAGPDDIPEGAKPFPKDLSDATDKLEHSDHAVRLFGKPFVENFVKACRLEDASLRTAVSPEERQRYLEL
jgi:glutamine synthetase